MPYVLKHDPALGIVEVTLTGPLTAEQELRGMTSDAIAVQRQTGAVLFLLDINGWDVRAPFSAIYEISDTQYRQEELLRHSRIAVILPTSASAREAASFYETVCYNRGWKVRICSDRRDAIDWLRGPDSTPR